MARRPRRQWVCGHTPMSQSPPLSPETAFAPRGRCQAALAPPPRLVQTARRAGWRRAGLRSGRGWASTAHAVPRAGTRAARVPGRESREGMSVGKGEMGRREESTERGVLPHCATKRLLTAAQNPSHPLCCAAHLCHEHLSLVRRHVDVERARRQRQLEHEGGTVLHFKLPPHFRHGAAQLGAGAKPQAQLS